MNRHKDKRVEIRITAKKKQELQDLASQTGQSFTDIIMARLENMPIKDYKRENEFFISLHQLTQELGHIGSNINQVTRAIHQIHNSQKINQGEFAEFNQLMREYLGKRTQLSNKLEEIFFK